MRLGYWRRCGFGRCSVQVLMTVRDGRVPGDVVSGAGAGAALGCYWLLFSGVGDGAGAYGWQGAIGRVLFGVSWLSHHHDAGRSIMMLSAASWCC